MAGWVRRGRRCMGGMVAKLPMPGCSQPRGCRSAADMGSQMWSADLFTAVDYTLIHSSIYRYELLIYMARTCTRVWRQKFGREMVGIPLAHTYCSILRVHTRSQGLGFKRMGVGG